MDIANIKVSKLLAEFVGAFALTFAVLASINGVLAGAVATPVLAGIVLALFVLSVGAISGSHINPAVTVGMFSVRQIDWVHAIGYIAAQLLGALAAVGVMNGFLDKEVIQLVAKDDWDSKVMLAEALGAGFFVFGVAATVHRRFDGLAGAVLAGGSLFLGIVFASAAGSLGVLNPAVALGLDIFNWTYIVGPIVGAVVGANVYALLMTSKGQL